MPSGSSSSASEDAYITDSDVGEDVPYARADAAPAKPAKAKRKAKRKASVPSTALFRRPEPHEYILIPKNVPLFFALLDASESDYSNQCIYQEIQAPSCSGR